MQEDGPPSVRERSQMFERRERDTGKNRDTDWEYKPKEKQHENRGGARKKVTSSGIRSQAYHLRPEWKEDPEHDRQERHGSRGRMRNECTELTSNQSAYRYQYGQREEQKYQPFGIAMEDRHHDTKESYGSRDGMWEFGWKNSPQEEELARRGQYGRRKGQKHQQHRSATEGLKPISLAKVKKDGLQVDTEALHYLMEKEELKGKPLAIISVAGTTRSGKSFILNFFLKYLRKRGWENPDWLGDDEDEITRDFLWEKGEKACTQGIAVWPEIFHVLLKDGQECAVIVVDTQGLYDHDTAPDTNAKLMSLSTLFSSCQILNIMRQIEERDLEHLQLSASFAKKAAEMEISRNERPFQTLMFLIRDWEHNNRFGDRTDEFLIPFLSTPSRSSVVQKVKESIFDSFAQALCFRLPRPGDKVVDMDSANENLCNKDVKENFKKLVKILAERVLHPDNIVIKKMASGKKATANDLKNLLGTIGQAFVKGKMPTAGTLLQNYAQSNNRNAVAEAVKIYRENLKSQIRDRMVNNDDFCKYHEASFDKACKTFDSEANLGDEDSKIESRQHLAIECNYAMNSYKQRNDTKKLKLLSELQEITMEWLEKYRTATTPVNLSITDEEFNQIYTEHKEKALKSFNSAARGLEDVLPEIQREKKNLKRKLDVKNREATELRNNEKKKQREESKRCVKREKENFQYEATKYRGRYKAGLDIILNRMKCEALKSYKAKMRRNTQKSPELLEEELDKIIKESMLRNTELKNEELKEESKRCVQVEKEKFEKEATKLRGSCTADLETILNYMKSVAQMSYEEKMQSNPYKNSASLGQQLDRIMEDLILRNSERENERKEMERRMEEEKERFQEARMNEKKEMEEEKKRFQEARMNERKEMEEEKKRFQEARMNEERKRLEKCVQEEKLEKEKLQKEKLQNEKLQKEARINDELREQSKTCVQEEKENFRKKAEVYRGSYEERLETKLMSMKDDALRRYKNKMQSNPYKNSKSLKEELDEIMAESNSRNGELKDLLRTKCENKGREFAEQCEADIEKEMDDAYLDPSTLNQHVDKFFDGNVKKDEEYKKFPDWGQDIVKAAIEKKRAELQERNKCNEEHRSVKLSTWGKIVNLGKSVIAPFVWAAKGVQNIFLN